MSFIRFAFSLIIAAATFDAEASNADTANIAPIYKKDNISIFPQNRAKPTSTSKEQQSTTTKSATAPYTTDNTLPVGAIYGIADVTATGAATYKIPIKMPAGNNGFQPTINICYNSQSGNGILGYGWSVSGTSSISRCGYNIYYDGSAREVKLNDTDNLMLDGKRLILVSGKNLAEGAKYQMEDDPTTDIEYKEENGLLGFVVRTKDGITKKYGMNYTATFNTGSVASWLLSSCINEDGQEIGYTYTYDEHSNERYLSDIGFGTIGQNVISFKYEDRDDTEDKYANGHITKMTKRLKSIDVRFFPVYTTEEYKFEYTYDGLYSKLSKITKYGKNGEEHFNPTIINYSGSKSGSEALIPFSNQSSDIMKLFADYDGDGKPDFISFPVPVNGQYNNSHKIRLYLNRHTSTGQLFVLQESSIPLSSAFKNIIIADINGDGRKDLVVINDIGSNKFRYNYYESEGYCFTYSGKGFTTNDSHAMPGDFDGDGRDEILVEGNQTVFNGEGEPIAAGGIDDWGKMYQENYFPNNRFFGDFNGNGKTDILCCNSIEAWVYELEGNKFVDHWELRTPYITNGHYTYCGDFNGDGKTDILAKKIGDDTNVSILISMSSGFVRNKLANPDIKSIVKVGDFNRDGKSDIYHMEEVGNRILMKIGISNGKGFTTKSYMSDLLRAEDIKDFSYYRDTKFLLDDFDGDGRAEFACACYSDVIVLNSFDDNGNLLVSSITDGLGKTTKFEYNALTAPGISSCSTSSFPVRETLVPLIVTTKMEDGATNYLCNSYAYSSPRMHVQGKGFLGFGKMYTINNTLGTKTEISYGINSTFYYPYISSQCVTNLQGNKISTIKYINSYDTYYSKRYIPYIQEKTEKDELTQTTITTETDIDKLGNVISVRTNYGDGITETTTTEYLNSTTETSWIIGKPLSETKTMSRGNGTWTEKNAFTYDNRHRLATTTKFVGNSLQQALQTTYQYTENGILAGYTTKAYNSPYTLQTQYVNMYENNLDLIVSEIDCNSNTTNYEYDEFGEMIYKEEAGRPAITISRDGFGRITKTTGNDGTNKSETLTWDNSIPGSVYKMTCTETGKPVSTIYYDAMGRKLRVSQMRFDGTFLHYDIQYNTKGLVSKISMPYKSHASKWNTYNYDDYGRLIKLEYASGKIDTYSYNNRSITKSIDGISKTENHNGKGEIISITDNTGTITYNLRPDGQPASITAPGNVTTIFGYDSYGRRTSINDPSVGIMTFAYDDSGNLTKQTSPDGKTTTMEYDELGNLTKKTRPEFVTVYTYDNFNRLTKAASSNSTSISYSYDNFGRISNEKEYASNFAQNSIWLEKRFSYLQGNINSISYISQSGTIGTETRSYTNGTLSEITFNNESVWKLNSENVIGKPTSINTGCLKREYSYDTNGFETGRNVYALENRNIMSHSNAYIPVTGCMIYRKDNLKNITEDFSYDSANRLTNFGGNNVTYDAKGNILSKSDITAKYKYETQGKPYAVSDIEFTHGDVTIDPRPVQISYYSFLRPERIKNENIEIYLKYNDRHNKSIMTVTQNGNLVMTRHYVSDCYEIDKKPFKIVSMQKNNTIGNTQYATTENTIQRLYIGGDAYTAPAVYINDGSGWKMHYICRDVLGSIMVITNDQGNVEHEYSYDAWGRLRNPDNHQTYMAGQEPELFLGRGYCGHELLPGFGLWNMNARIYDPALGRFLSPDPHVQDPYNSQGFNRYSYCLNNPLKYMDKDGEFWFLVAATLTFGIGNTVVHAIRGDIDSVWDGFKYFFQGGLVGATLGVAWYLAPSIPMVGNAIQATMGFYAYAQGGVGISGIVTGVLNEGLKGMYQGLEVFLGNFYVDENSFIGGVIQGISRHTWEMMQTFVGETWATIANSAKGADRVDFLGGATFTTIENSDEGQGVTLGNYITIKNKGEIEGKFDEYVINNPMYMHEYGHTIDSRKFGLSYLFAIGLPSLVSANRNQAIYGPPFNTHQNFYTEHRANRNAAAYFGKHYGVDWNRPYSRPGHDYPDTTIDNYYPRW